MIKGLIKKILYKIYQIGRYEDLRIRNTQRLFELNNTASIGFDSEIDGVGCIYNYQLDKSKIRIGSHTSIMGELCVYKHGGDLSIGDYCFVGPRTRIQSALKIQIGNRVLIAHDVNIMDNNSHPLDSRERHLDYARFRKHGLADQIDLREAEILIEDDVWIGFGATILKGVKIGRGAIIGSNAVITANVDPYSVMVGNPARRIKYVT